jgi:hypothetical protein
MRYYPAVGPAIPHSRAGCSRVTHPFAGDTLRCPLDLHVLSTPPAFVLSQDQTLQEEFNQLSRTAHNTHCWTIMRRSGINQIRVQSLARRSARRRSSEIASHIPSLDSIINQQPHRIGRSLQGYSAMPRPSTSSTKPFCSLSRSRNDRIVEGGERRRIRHDAQPRLAKVPRCRTRDKTRTSGRIRSASPSSTVRDMKRAPGTCPFQRVTGASREIPLSMSDATTPALEPSTPQT